MHEHHKKTILITGATAGFGEAVARIFSKNGYKLIITGRRKERLLKLKEELSNQNGTDVLILCFDIRNPEEVKKAVEILEEQSEQIDILVNNAGLASGISPIDEGEFSDWEVMIDTNIKGLLYITRLILPFMKKQGSGHIFNIGSTAGKQVYKNGNVYCATKFAVDALSQAMRIDLLPYNIKVTAVNPGMAETEFSMVRFKGDAEKAKKVYEDLEPLHAGDIADLVFYCAGLPAHVCINDLTVTCTNQANSVYSIRNSEKSIQQKS